MRRLPGWALSVSTIVGWAASADAEASFQLSWEAPPDCAGAPDVRARVESMVAGAPESMLDRPLTVNGTVTVSERGAALELTTDHGGVHGERRLEGASCQEVTSAGSLVIALIIDPNARDRTSPEAGGSAVAAFEAPGDSNPNPKADAPAPATAPPSTSKGAPAATPIADDAFEDPDAPTPTPALALGAAFDTVALPSASFGVALSTWFGTDRWRLGGEGTYFPPRVAEAEGFPDKGGDIALAILGVSACWTPIGSDVRFGACALAESGALLAGGRNIENQKRDVEPWLAFGAMGALWIQAGGPIGIGLRAGPVVPLGRPSFRFLSETGEFVEIHRPDPLGFRASVGAEWQFR